MHKIEIVIGTMRQGAYSRKAGLVVFDIYKSLGADVGLIDLKDMSKDAFLPEAYEDRPRAIGEFSDRLLAAAGVVIVTPEYNSSLPGVLKHFIDLWKFPDTFKRKFCLVGVSNGRWGGIRALEHLGSLLLNRGANVFPEKSFLPDCEELFDESGNIKDEKAKGRLERQARNFLEFLK
ncbi:MAG: NADPH-dependent FMN reductase [Candidatus Paceibacterota bacterium]|jgi:NAD(P)H-dependent FMN reductase